MEEVGRDGRDRGVIEEEVVTFSVHNGSRLGATPHPGGFLVALLVIVGDKSETDQN